AQERCGSSDGQVRERADLGHPRQGGRGDRRRPQADQGSHGYLDLRAGSDVARSQLETHRHAGCQLVCGTRGERQRFALAAGTLAACGAVHPAVAVVAAAAFLLASPAIHASSPGKAGGKMKPAVTYTPLAFRELPGWEEDDQAAAFKAFLTSCARVGASARERAANDKLPPPPAALVAACAAATELASPVGRTAAKAFFEAHFTPNAVVHDGARGLLTGYYEPLVEGSRTAQGVFQTPIYKRPPDLVN